MKIWIFLLTMILAWPVQAAWIRADEVTGEIYEVWREELYAKAGEVSVDVGNAKFTVRTHRWDGNALRLATAAEIATWDAKFNPPNPSLELEAALTGLKGTGATIDQLIDALLGQAGKAGRIAGRP
ncbi:hypothetical protein LCGC14_2751040 [marine sediment metagenome]|uniref:Uncharacterized protein n=1 Tax=marine sediment metagenome TaxID=412755 RepID=A0A0F8Z1W7_9ZZZZ